MHIGVTSHLWLMSALHASSHPCMCTCVLRCGLFSPRLSLFSTSSHRSSSSPSRCSPQCSTRGSGPTPCATSAWGPWPLLTTRHPSQVMSPTRTRTFVNTDELDLTATSDVYWQHTLDDDASFLNDPDVDDNQLSKYLASCGR